MATGEEGGAVAGEAQRRLVLCFDGTWNAHEDQTNVARLYDAVADYKSNCPHQQKYYDEGVGTTAWTKVRGGLTGYGLEENILEGYSWLIRELSRGDWAPASQRTEADGQVFDVGPDIFLFGFSRGAFTARSLGGLINRCGIPHLASLDIKDKDGKPVASPTIPQIRESSRVVEAWNLYREQLPHEGRLQPGPVTFRKNRCWTVKIKLLGVWDTVGARGLPLFRSALVPFSQAHFAFHDTSLGRVVENAFHAMAIDEHRKDYEIALWTARHPNANQTIEQRWFPGAHSNVGGGYQDDLLPDAPLEWMATMAKGCGMQFIRNPAETSRTAPNCATALPADFALTGDEYRWPVRDSYTEFMFGIYSTVKRARRLFIDSGRHYRTVLTHGIEEKVDITATLKMSADPNYRPRNLALAGLKP